MDDDDEISCPGSIMMMSSIKHFVGLAADMQAHV